MKTPEKGLVVGKFYPPHLGHDALIEKAASNCDQTDVLVIENPKHKFSGERRAAILRTQHPNVNVQVMPDICVVNDSLAWAKATIKFLGYTPDKVFSSEHYGDNYARFMDCEHVCFDRARQMIPVSGTGIRQDFLKYWQYLGTATRQELAIRIGVVNPERLGLESLAQNLAKRGYEATLITPMEQANNTNVQFPRLLDTAENRQAAQSNGITLSPTELSATAINDLVIITDDMATATNQIIKTVQEKSVIDLAEYIS